jgi:hypothetical protein
MPRVFFRMAGLLIWMAHAGAQMPAQPYTPASLASELRRLQGAASSGPLKADRLPAAWEVQTPQRRYSVSSEPLRKALSAGNVEQAQKWLDMVAQQLEGYQAAPAASRARAKLDRILARREFGGSAQPSAVEMLRRRMVAWFVELLRRLFGALGEHTTTLAVLFWMLVAACVGFLALMLIRWWTRDGPIASLPAPNRTDVPVRTWQEWLAAARQAAEEGDWRQAIHCAYWSAIRLQDSGALPADLTHTPREFLRLMSDQPASREPLAALTSGLERFWYAQRAAGAEDFRESLTHLETLGCKVE